MKNKVEKLYNLVFAIGARDEEILAEDDSSVGDPISYPESSGFLVSGATPGRLWGHRILLPQDFCGKTMETVTEQPIKKIEFF